MNMSGTLPRMVQISTGLSVLKQIGQSWNIEPKPLQHPSDIHFTRRYPSDRHSTRGCTVGECAESRSLTSALTLKIFNVEETITVD